MSRLRVHRKSYFRAPYRRKDGTKVKGARVDASTFFIRDRGAKGRSRRIIPKLKKGTLGINFSASATTRRRKLIAKAKRIGEKKIVGKLRALQVLNKRTNPSLARKALADSKFIAGSFIGRRKVNFPTGFRRKRR